MAFLSKILLLAFTVIAVYASSLQAQQVGDTLATGTASFYADRFHMRKTANGEVFHMDSLTAAHKHLPFGTELRVIRPSNGKEVVVRINDRLPRNSTRMIDLSKGAARELGMLRDGLAKVHLQLLAWPGDTHRKRHIQQEISAPQRRRLSKIRFKKEIVK